MRIMLRLFLLAGLLVAIAAVAVVGYLYVRFGSDLPDVEQLAGYEPPVTSRVYAEDGRLMGEFSREHRLFVPIDQIPPLVQDAFLSAEDKTFRDHIGLDVPGIVAAAIDNFRAMGTDRRPRGASTITQQVAKNFLLTNELSLERKVKEAILAMRIEEALDKDRILELYLNEIFLGARSYGVAAAALNYFNKPLAALDVAEAAFLAALPKAPNNYDPARHPEAARARRDWVIDRMATDGHIDREAATAAKAEPIEISRRGPADYARADYAVEEIRRELIDRLGEDGVYGGGLTIRATVEPRLQAIADRALRDGLEAYDRRHGWRGPLTRIDVGAGWEARLAAVPSPAGIDPWRVAAVLAVEGSEAAIGLADGATGRIPLAELRWARPWRKGQRVGPAVGRVDQVVEPGDVVLVVPVAESDKGKAYPAGTYALRQVPAVGGALAAIDPHTGRVLALSGGFSFDQSQFNRATQAMRQPGSAFKPFVYMAGLEGDYTPTTLINDAPITLPQGPGMPMWRPKNYSGKSYGPTTLRRGVEKSRNLMTVRLAHAVGMDRVADVAERFGVYDDMAPHLAQALGSGETTVLRLTTAYAMIANGGRRLLPTLIDRIQDRHGRTVYRHDRRACQGCDAQAFDNVPPQLVEVRDQVIDPVIAYQMTSILEGVVQRGTGVRVRDLGRPVAGKTGTTNDSNDAWFVGFTPDLAVGVFVGFDDPTSLGGGETGSSVAAPVFRDFMASALEDVPIRPFPIPRGAILVPVDLASGRPVRPGSAGSILEAFRPGTSPYEPSVIDDAGLAFGAFSGSFGLAIPGSESDDAAASTFGESGSGLY